MINNDNNNNTYLGIINYASSSYDIIVVVTVIIGYRSLFGLDFLVTTLLMHTPKYSFCASIHSDCISASLAITSFIAGTSSSWLHFS